MNAIADQVPHGMPNEPMPGPETLGFRVPLYGFKKWSDLFTERQLLALMTFVKWMQAAQVDMKAIDYSSEWLEAISAYLVCAFDRMLDHNSNLIFWRPDSEASRSTFVRYALPMTQDFSECAILNEVPGSYQICLGRILSSLETARRAHITETPNCVILRESATDLINQEIDAIVTDPPYYDAIPWPCPPAEADKIGLKVSQPPVTIDPNDLIGGDVESAWESGQPTLALIKETLEAKRGVSIPDDVFRYAVEQAIKVGIIASDDEPLTNGFYKIRVRKPAWMRHTDSQLTELQVQELTETVITLAEIAPELDFKFCITITAEGEPPSNEVLEKMNTALQKVTEKLKFE